MDKEIWKDIPDFEGLYQVRNLGRVINIKNKKYKKISKYKNGYLYVDLYKDNKKTKKLLHRLIAETFIPNPNNYPVINHKDGNKLNNKIENLEWCTYSHNTKEAYRLGLKKPVKIMLGKKGKDCPNSKKINQYDLRGNYIKTWDSLMDIQRELGINHSNISACCLGKINKSVKGYQWRFYEGNIKKIKPLKRDRFTIKIMQYDLEGNFIKEWKSIAEASQKLNIYRTSISRCARGKYKHAGGYLWKEKV